MLIHFSYNFGTSYWPVNNGHRCFYLNLIFQKNKQVPYSVTFGIFPRMQLRKRLSMLSGRRKHGMKAPVLQHQKNQCWHDNIEKRYGTSFSFICQCLDFLRDMVYTLHIR